MATSHTEQQQPHHLTSKLSQTESSITVGMNMSATAQPLHQSSIVPSRPSSSAYSQPGHGQYPVHPHPIPLPPGGRMVQQQVTYSYYVPHNNQMSLSAGAATTGGQVRNPGCNPGSNPPQGTMVMAPTPTTTTTTTSSMAHGSSSPVDPSRRRLRLKSNRESARKSRQKKKEYVDQLRGRIEKLEAEKKELSVKLKNAEMYCATFNFCQ